MTRVGAQELCEIRDGRPGLPVPNSPYGLCARKATLKKNLDDRRYYSKFSSVSADDQH